MKIPIKTTKEKFYREFLEVIKSFPPLNKLRPRELGLLAELMQQNKDNESLPLHKRRLIIYSTENRKEIQDRLEMTQAVFNNMLSNLRKHKLVSKEGNIIPILNIKPENEYTIEVKFLME